jgi:F0F1-type ATP synthase epsilon subunit
MIDKTVAKNKIRIKIHSPFRTYFDGNAVSVSATNDTGPFDVLPKHHRFMTILNAGEVIVRGEDSKQQKYNIDRGIMHVRDDHVTIFLDV